MKSIFSSLRLVVQLMNSTEAVGKRLHRLASEGPDIDAKPNDSVRSQLMKVDPKPLQYICNNPIDRKSTRLNSSHITRSRMPSSA